MNHFQNPGFGNTSFLGSVQAPLAGDSFFIIPIRPRVGDLVPRSCVRAWTVDPDVHDTLSVHIGILGSRNEGSR